MASWALHNTYLSATSSDSWQHLVGYLCIFFMRSTRAIRGFVRAVARWLRSLVCRRVWLSHFHQSSGIVLYVRDIDMTNLGGFRWWDLENFATVALRSARLSPCSSILSFSFASFVPLNRPRLGSGFSLVGSLVSRPLSCTFALSVP